MSLPSAVRWPTYFQVQDDLGDFGEHRGSFFSMSVAVLVTAPERITQESLEEEFMQF